jgi:DNA invertase Pin-like site-specific DNA recombinase
MGMAVLGYARVSTDHQSLDQQHDALTAASVDRIFSDTISGTRDDRPGLAALLDYAREGDTVVVVALDRLGRSLAGIVRTIETLTERGIMLRSLREGIDYSTPVGRMVAGIFASLAEYERELIHERAAVARQAARARGKQTGRPRALSADQVRLARRMREAGESVSTIRTTLRVARSTVYRAFNDVEQDVEQDTEPAVAG